MSRKVLLPTVKEPPFAAAEAWEGAKESIEANANDLMIVDNLIGKCFVNAYKVSDL